MPTKMKGLFKGLRYISQIFEDEKEEEMQIGLPTDVKHIAHIGCDGPSVESTPSWMKEFKSSDEPQSGPIDSFGDNRGDVETKRVAEDSRRGSRAGRDSPEVPRSFRRHSGRTGDESPKKREGSTRSRHSRRNNSKDSLEGSVRSARLSAELSPVPESPLHGLPEIPKKSRKKKPKDGDSASTRLRSKPASGPSNDSDREYAAGALNDENDKEGKTN